MERAENRHVMVGGNRSAGVLRMGIKWARCSFQQIPLPDHHDGGYRTDQH